MAGVRKRVPSTHEKAGQTRQELYKAACAWVTQSIREGYYLEAISLVDSLISDRLESHLSFRLKRDFGFKNLGELINGIKGCETDKTLRSLVLNELDDWRDTRNRAAHEMVKLEVGQSLSWEERTALNKAAAKTGFALFRKIDRQTRKLRQESEGRRGKG